MTHRKVTRSTDRHSYATGADDENFDNYYRREELRHYEQRRQPEVNHRPTLDVDDCHQAAMTGHHGHSSVEYPPRRQRHASRLDDFDSDDGRLPGKRGQSYGGPRHHDYGYSAHRYEASPRKQPRRNDFNDNGYGQRQSGQTRDSWLYPSNERLYGDDGGDDPGTPVRRRQRSSSITPTRSRTQLERRYASSNEYKSVIKPDKYDGKSCLETFLVKFESLSAYNKWNKYDMAAHLKASLVDSAGAMLWQIKDATYDEVVAKLRHRFGNQEQQEKFRIELRTRKRRRGETLQELSQDIENLVALAFPDTTMDTRDILALEAFIEALGEPGLSYKIREKGTSTLQDAVIAAMNLEVLRNSRTHSRDQSRPR